MFFGSGIFNSEVFSHLWWEMQTEFWSPRVGESCPERERSRTHEGSMRLSEAGGGRVAHCKQRQAYASILLGLCFSGAILLFAQQDVCGRRPCCCVYEELALLPLCAYTTFFSPFTLLLNIRMISGFQLLWIKLTWTSYVPFGEHIYSFLLGMY